MHLTLSPARTTRKAAAATNAAHARSASDPCHPALARLEGAVRALRAWSYCCCCGGAACSSSSSSGYGLALLEAALAALGETLATPRASAAFHGADDDQALDGFLVLADAYGTFGATLLAARQGVADAQAGARRGDGAALAASARAHRRIDKELRHLAAAMRHASRHAVAATVPTSPDATGAEVVSVVASATVAAAEASAVIFSRCAAMSPDVSAMAHTVSSHKWLARLGVGPAASKVAPETASAALERLEELEECIAGLESGSEKVFRRLLQARVLLLNIHNPL
ncbi:hypothetical protein BAE44_0021872 [Dichanthelium oligosanthes]|uniref:Uncharacterized protein n=1 Tax=Dichanthelium oligosanthes TaxID=888268 RepID=A0A1E5UW42_9POAL|nr:hypothetical protein BAE44_0021872 [Dichanthelium oligosanthes]